MQQKIEKKIEDMTDTIRKWPNHPFQSLLLNSLWNLIPGFFYWIVWKERNNRVFNNISKPIDTLWLLLKKNLQETLAIRHWQDSDLPDSPQEHLIMKAWNLDLTFLAQVKSKPPTSSASPLNWSPPVSNSYKLNFDGVAKGNPCPASYGGVFRNEMGTVLHNYHGTIGNDTNNATELEGLWKEICIAEGGKVAAHKRQM